MPSGELAETVPSSQETLEMENAPDPQPQGKVERRASLSTLALMFETTVVSVSSSGGGLPPWARRARFLAHAAQKWIFQGKHGQRKSRALSSP